MKVFSFVFSLFLFFWLFMFVGELLIHIATYPAETASVSFSMTLAITILKYSAYGFLLSVVYVLMRSRRKGEE